MRLALQQLKSMDFVLSQQLVFRVGVQARNHLDCYCFSWVNKEIPVR
jgi:hypothetical protein